MPESVCPQANNCAFVDPGAPECGMAGEHLPPLLASNELCIRALEGQVRTASEACLKPGSLAYGVACAKIDLAMAQPAGDPAAANLLDEAQEHLGAVLTEPRITPNLFLNVMLLDLHLPMFEAVHADTTLTRPEYIELQHDLAELAGQVEAGEAPDDVTRNHRARLIVAMMAARSRVPYLPALYRQARSRDPAAKDDCYDGVFLFEDTRVPVKVGNNRHNMRTRLGDDILAFPVGDMVKKTYPSTAAGWMDVHAMTYSALDALRREALGEKLGTTATNWLHTLGSEFKQRIHSFAAAKDPYAS